MLIDTHCHIHSSEHYPDPDQVIREAWQEGVETLVLVGTDLQDAEAAQALSERHDHVFFIAGIHPNYSKDFETRWIAELSQVLSHPKCLALGEIGLDYHWDYSPKETQHRCLQLQLDLAQELNMPVVFHCRDAYDDMLDLLETRSSHPYLIHCFGGSIEHARRAMALNCLFGVDGPVTYKKNAELREALREIGLERLVLETDSPYLTPEPFRKQINHPRFLKRIAQELAAVLGTDESHIAAATSKIANNFFRLGSKNKKWVDCSLAYSQP